MTQNVLLYLVKNVWHYYYYYYTYSHFHILKQCLRSRHCLKTTFLEAIAALDLGLSVTPSVGHSHFSKVGIIIQSLTVCTSLLYLIPIVSPILPFSPSLPSYPSIPYFPPILNFQLVNWVFNFLTIFQSLN